MKTMKDAVVELDGNWPGPPGTKNLFWSDEGFYGAGGRPGTLEYPWISHQFIGTKDDFRRACVEFGVVMAGRNPKQLPPPGAVCKVKSEDGTLWSPGVILCRTSMGSNIAELDNMNLIITDDPDRFEYTEEPQAGQHGDAAWREFAHRTLDEIERQTVRDWRPGETLPPVGTQCRVAGLPGGCLQAEKLRWVKNGLEVQIRAHMEPVEAGCADTVAVFSTVDPPHRWHALVAACFEPMPTPADLRIEAAMKASARDAYTHSDNMMRKATIIDLENAGMLNDPGKPEEPEQ